MDKLDQLVAKLIKEDRRRVRVYIRRHHLDLTPEAIAAFLISRNPDMGNKKDTIIIARMELDVWWNKSPSSQ